MAEPNCIARDRAEGALLGLAIGDALGMPTQTLSASQIEASYGVISDFTAAAAIHPVSHGLTAGTITDDTEQSVLLAELLIQQNGQFDERRWVAALLDWEKDIRARGINDLLGPSTKRAISLLLAGVPASETGKLGVTNGAAMRIAPVGIATPPEPLSRLILAVERASRVTHNTSEGIGSAAAVAAVVSMGVEGASFDEALPFALAAARQGEHCGAPATGGSISERIETVLALARGKTGLESAREISRQVGSRVAALESVPMAFAVVTLAGNDAWEAGLISANIGEDTDTIGAISAAMAGACSGRSQLPPAKTAFVTQRNRLDFTPIAQGLLDLRQKQLEKAA